MPFVAAPGIARVAVDYINSQADRGTNVFHVENVGGDPFTLITLNTLLDAVELWLTDFWADTAAEAWQTDQVTAKALDAEVGWVVSRSVTIDGTVVSEPLPSQNTLAMSWRTGLSGRSRRGRTYVVGLAENATQGSYVLPAVGSALVTAYQGLIDTIAAEFMALGVLSYVEDGLPRAVPLFSAYTNCVLVDTIVDSMDKRKPRAA